MSAVWTVLLSLDPCSLVAGAALVLAVLFGLYLLIALVDFLLGARWPGDDEN